MLTEKNVYFFILDFISVNIYVSFFITEEKPIMIIYAFVIKKYIQ